MSEAGSTNPVDGQSSLLRALRRINEARASLVVRIAVGVVILDLALTALLVALGVFVARNQLLTSFDNSLQSKAISLRALVRYDEDSSGELIFDPSGVPSAADPANPDVFAIYLPGGKSFAQSAGWKGLPPRTRYLSGGFVRYNAGGVPFRGLILRDVEILDREDGIASPAKITLVYAASTLGIRHRVLLVGVYLGGAGVVVLGVIACLTVWSVRRSVNPLHELARQAEGINARHWAFRAPESARRARELAPLTAAMETVVNRLHDSFASQRQFTSDLAHELKTHVAIIKSSLQILQRQPRSADEYRDGVGDLLADCERLEGLVERMLRLARIEQVSEDRRPQQMAASDVLSTCEAAKVRVDALAESKNVRVEIVSCAQAEVSADPDDLELVWMNLLDNAVRHSPAGSGVTMHVIRLDGAVQVSVEDSGEGISPNDIPLVFERFRRGNGGGERGEQGFGLGLAICKATVEGYGGSIELTSAVGRGTQVRVLLPLSAENVQSTTTKQGSPAAREIEFSGPSAESAR